MPKSRLYSDQEISSILKRAGQIQATQSPDETHGLSLEELQHIASEVGMDPKIVAMAAAELEHSGIEEKSFGFLGASTSMYIERVIPGEIDQELLPEVAAKIGEAFGMVGTSGQVGRSLEWTHASERSNLQVTVMPRNGQTKVRVTGKFPRVALGFFLPALVIGGMWTAMIPLAMDAPPAVALGVSALGLMIGYLVSRFGFSAYVKKKERAAEKLMRELDEMIDEPASAMSKMVVENKQSSPTLDIPDADSSEDEALKHSKSRRKTT